MFMANFSADDLLDVRRAVNARISELFWTYVNESESEGRPPDEFSREHDRLVILSNKLSMLQVHGVWKDA